MMVQDNVSCLLQLSQSGSSDADGSVEVLVIILNGLRERKYGPSLVANLSSHIQKMFLYT